MAKQMTRDDLEKEAIRIVNEERQQWEDAVCFITERVAFNMRNVIRKCRKNYYGVFDEPNDPTTGREKVWVHLTQEFCDSMRKSTDMDTKDINFKAKHPSAIGKTRMVKTIFGNYLDATYFGEDLDEHITDKVVDGTAVWLTEEEYNKEIGRKAAKRTRVDLLNVYIDPTARSIQEAYRFTTRILMTESEVKSHKDWINTEKIEGSEGLNRNDGSIGGQANTGKQKYVDVWRMHGKGPESLITGNKEDTKEIDLEIICSGLERAGREKVHLVQKYNGTKPYEEDWLFRVPGRWYGLGVPEKLIWYQLWANTTVNIRINRAMVAQLGIFQIRKGSGITPQMLSKLAAMGAVEVTNMDTDIRQLPMQEASQASYKDEEVIQTRSQRVTGLYEAATGESLPSSTPATNAAIQNNAAQSGATLLKEGTGMFLERWIKRQALPIELKQVKVGDLIRMELDPEDLRRFDEGQVNADIAGQLEEINAQRGFVDPNQVMMEQQRAVEQLKSSKERFINMEETLNVLEYDVEVFITNEKIDKGVLSQNLLTAIQLAPEYKQQILQAAFDLWGVSIKMENPMQQMPQPAQPGMPQVPTQNPQEVMTNANTNAAR